MRMFEATTSRQRTRAWVSGWITAMLSIAACCAISFGLWLTLGTPDTEPMESPAILSVARQLEHGPWGLYGPFGRQNLLVLIHAPLYYQLAAVLAWPLKVAGLHPITAARLAGRAISVVALLFTAWGAFRIARLDGAPGRAGWWAACLVASAPVVGNLPYTVRPDMVGVALETAGVLLILGALQRERPGATAIVGGFAAFALAICVKQHLLGGPLVATVLVLRAWRRGRIGARLVGMGLLTAAAIVAGIYVVEDVVAQGRASTAFLVAAPAAARVHPADWLRTGITLANIGGGSACLIALLAFAALAQVLSRPTAGRRAAGILGTLLAGVTLLVPLQDYFQPGLIVGLAASAAPFVCLFLVIPACALLERGSLFGSWLDGALCLLAAAEMFIVVVPLCLASTGAWVQYAIPGIVFAAIWTGRSLSRACTAARLGAAFVPIAVAAAAVPGFGLQGAYLNYHRMRAERLSAELVVAGLKAPVSEFYFVARRQEPSIRTDRPGLRRLALPGFRVGARRRAAIDLAA